jgi:hypothetical protein
VKRLARCRPATEELTKNLASVSVGCFASAPAQGMLGGLRNSVLRAILARCWEPRKMTEDIDIWRAAHLLLKRHGADAAIVAAQRADELLAQGDLDGQSIWKRIVNAVRELQRTKLTADERRN